MNKQTFIQLLKNPSGITDEQSKELEKVTSNFPYCQVAHILLAKQASDEGSMLADVRIQKAAAYTIDRKRLKKLINVAQEISVVPSITYTNPLPIEEEVPALQVESKIEVEKKMEKTSTLEVKPTITSLSDQKREDIIRELQENLKKLHDSKIKAAWEDIPEKEIKVVGVNVVENKEVEETLSYPQETSENTIALEETPTETISISNISPVSPIESAPLEENQSSIPDHTIPSLVAHTNTMGGSVFIPRATSYPLRTEDVIVEETQTESDTTILIEYLQFLEQRRTVFRKNKKKEAAIIDKFIKEDPSIPKLDIRNLPETSQDLSSKSTSITKGPISENFAKILALQGKREKAIEIYQELILKNPEKKPYFEAQIEKLKNKI